MGGTYGNDREWCGTKTALPLAPPVAGVLRVVMLLAQGVTVRIYVTSRAHPPQIIQTRNGVS
jgi:hypothetical protein